jgi:hypothetical protein
LNSAKHHNSGKRSDRQFVFTLTSGRSGTGFLAALLKSNLTRCQVHHEQIRFEDWGKHTPELSQLTTFNNIGNSPMVRAFWEQKFAHIQAQDVTYYAETAHVLAKAGLIENLDLLESTGTVHLIDLRRDIADTAISFVNRDDFIDKGNMWLWYLEPDYRKVIISPAPLQRFGQLGNALWYLCEMRARAEYYRLLLAARTGIVIHSCKLEDITSRDGASSLLNEIGMDIAPQDVILPGMVNADQNKHVSESSEEYIRSVVGACKCDDVKLATDWYEAGNRF